MHAIRGLAVRKSLVMKKVDKSFIFFPDVLNVSGKFNSDELSRDMSVGDDGKDEPFFEQRQGVKSPQNVSALIGKTAFLSCIVRNLGKAKSVSSILKTNLSSIVVVIEK